MSLLAYRLDDITEAHLEDLCERQVAESFYIEYKKEMYKLGNFAQELEMVKDVVAFANAAGGDIVVGIQEKGDGVAETVRGIDEAENSRDRMMRVLITSIQPRIPGLTPHIVPLKSEKSVLILRIPRSPMTPHMVTLKGRYGFWRRHDRHKSPMSVEEIRQACLASEGMRQRAEDLLASRGKELECLCGDRAWLVVATTPLLLREDLVDPFTAPLRDLILEPPVQARHHFALEFGNVHEFPLLPTLRGSVRSMTDLKRLEVWTNGRCEFRFNLMREFARWRKVPVGNREVSILDPHAVLYICQGFLAFAQRVYEACGYLGRLAVSLSIVNAGSVSLKPQLDYTEEEKHLSTVFQSHTAEDPHVTLPHKVVQAPSDLPLALRALLDRLWRAYHWEGCPCFDEEGKVRPDPTRRGS